MPISVANFLKNANWGSIDKVHATKDGKYYSFAVEVDETKRIVTVGIGPDSATLTISDMKGNVLAHAMQKGEEVTYFTPSKK
jgi:hypothetical protein